MNNPFLTQTLKTSLAEWTDCDVAAYYVAVALGVAPDPGNKWNFWGGKKWIFWSANILGEGMYQTLEMLANSGVLEKDKKDMTFRWNPNYDWEKYGKETTKA